MPCAKVRLVLTVTALYYCICSVVTGRGGCGVCANDAARVLIGFILVVGVISCCCPSYWDEEEVPIPPGAHEEGLVTDPCPYAAAAPLP